MPDRSLTLGATKMGKNEEKFLSGLVKCLAACDGNIYFRINWLRRTLMQVGEGFDFLYNFFSSSLPAVRPGYSPRFCSAATPCLRHPVHVAAGEGVRDASGGRLHRYKVALSIFRKVYCTCTRAVDFAVKWRTMKSRNISGPLFSLSLLAIAQSSAWGQNPAADTAWQKVAGLSSAQLTVPLQPQTPGGALTAGLLTQEQQIIANFVEQAKQAKAFYTQFSTDARAASAKKIEVMATLQAAQQGSHQHLIAGLGLGGAFRADKRNSAHDRFDVALSTELLQLPGVRRGQGLRDDPISAQQVGDRLYAEFGGSDDVAGYYMNLMRTLDSTSVLSVAQKVQTLTLSKEVQDEAKLVQNRYARVGKRVEELTMLSVDGRKIDFTAIKQPTIVYFWNSASGTTDLTLLTSFKATISPGIAWIYVGLGPQPKNEKQAESVSPFSGTYIYDPSALGSAAAAALSVAQCPQFAAIANGSLVGFGDLGKLPGVIASFGH